VCTRCGIVGADRPAPSASLRRIDSLRLGSRQARAVRHALRKAGSNPKGVAAINPVMHQEASEEGAHLRPPRESQGHPSATPMAAVSSESRPPIHRQLGLPKPGAAVLAHDQPMAVVLDLMHPVGPGWRLGGQGRNAGVDEAVDAAHCHGGELNRKRWAGRLA
jgi:hypothetical protein